MSQDTKTASIDPDTIRLMIRHEDVMFSNRITWFCTVQGLLYTAMAFAWDKDSAKMLVYIFAGLGVAISISFYYALRAAVLAIEAQRTWWDEHKPSNYSGPDVVGRRPDARSKPWLRPQIVLPYGFALAWVLTGLVRLLAK